MQRIKSVGVLSVAKISGLCYLALGLIFVPIFLVVAMVSSVAARQTGAPVNFGPAVGLVLAICMPVIYGVIGFVFGALGAVVYNVVAGWVGGIELDLQLEPTVPPIVVGGNQ